MKKTWLIVAAVWLLTFSAHADIPRLIIGGVELELGMSQDTVIKGLADKHLTVTAIGDGNCVITKSRTLLGNISFDNGRLCFINKSISTESWPRNEGPSAALAIYDAINALIASNDSDKAKRATAFVVLANREYVTESDRGTLRTIDLFIGNAEASITIQDAPLGKSVGVELTLKSKNE